MNKSKTKNLKKKTLKMFKVREDVDDKTWEKVQIYLQAVLKDEKSREEAMALAMGVQEEIVGCKQDLYRILMKDAIADMNKYSTASVNDSITEIGPCIAEMRNLYNKSNQQETLRSVNIDFFYKSRNNKLYFMTNAFLTHGTDKNKIVGKRYGIFSEKVGIYGLRSTVPRYLDFMKFIGQLYAFYGALEDAGKAEEIRTLIIDIENATDVEAIRDAVNPARVQKRREEAEAAAAEQERRREAEAEAAEEKRRQEETERLRQEEQRRQEEAAAGKKREAERKRKEEEAAEAERRRQEAAAKKEYLSTEDERKRFSNVNVFSSLLPNLRTWYNITIPENRVQKIFDNMKQRDAIIYLWVEGNKAGPMKAGMDDLIRQKGIDSGNLKEFAGPSLTESMRKRQDEQAAAEQQKREAERKRKEKEEKEEVEAERRQAEEAAQAAATKQETEQRRRQEEEATAAEDSVELNWDTIKTLEDVTPEFIRVLREPGFDFDKTFPRGDIDRMEVLKLVAKQLGITRRSPKRSTLIQRVKDKLAETSSKQFEQGPRPVLPLPIRKEKEEEEDETVEEIAAKRNIGKKTADWLSLNLFAQKPTQGLTLDQLEKIAALMDDFNKYIYKELSDDEKQRFLKAFNIFKIFNEKGFLIAGLNYGRPVQMLGKSRNLVTFTQEDGQKDRYVTTIENFKKLLAYYTLVTSITRKLDPQRTRQYVIDAFKGWKKPKLDYLVLSDNVFGKVQGAILDLKKIHSLNQQIVFDRYIDHDMALYDIDGINSNVIPKIASTLNTHWDRLKNDPMGFDLARTLRIHPNLAGITTNLDEISTSISYVGSNFEAQTDFLKSIAHLARYAESDCTNHDELDMAHEHFKLYRTNERY